MNRLWLLTAGLLAGCSPDADKAATVLYDPGYTIEIVLDNADGITSPDGLWWHDNALYIADEGGSAIRRWDGKVVETLADGSSGIASPEDLVVDAKGQVWFTDDTSGGLWFVTSKGALRVAGSEAITESEGIALLADGSVWVGDGKRAAVAAFPKDGSGPIPVIKDWQVAKPESMARMTDNTLWLADNREDRLIRFGSDGGAREWLLPDDLSPESIAAAGDTLWITDSHNGRLYRLDSKTGKTETVAAFLADFANINGLTIDPAGAVYISIQSDLDAGKGYIVRLLPQPGVDGSR